MVKHQYFKSRSEAISWSQSHKGVMADTKYCSYEKLNAIGMLSCKEGDDYYRWLVIWDDKKKNKLNTLEKYLINSSFTFGLIVVFLGGIIDDQILAIVGVMCMLPWVKSGRK